MSKIIRKLGLLCLASVALAATLAAPAASAAVSQPVAAVPVVAAADTSVCHDPEFGGDRLCAYSLHGFTLPDGTYQMFVIGTNYSVYTKWRRPNGTYSSWVNLGGQIRRSYSVSDFKVVRCGSQPLVLVVGTDNRWYHNGRRTNGTWSGWVLGGTVACPAS